MMEFQTNLKKFRTEEGLTQDQLALLVETSTDTIGRIERKQKIASYEVLFRIADRRAKRTSVPYSADSLRHN